MVGLHHRLNGHEFEHTPRVGDRERSLACCGPWGRKESHMTEWHLGCFQVLEILNKASIKHHVQGFVWMLVFNSFG